MMICPVCGVRHNKYPITCIRPVQNRNTYAMLARRTPSKEQQELYDKVCEYEKYWDSR